MLINAFKHQRSEEHFGRPRPCGGGGGGMGRSVNQLDHGGKERVARDQRSGLRSEG